MSRDTTYRLIWVFLFGIAIGFFEAAVVVYLRQLFYPDGFRFPLVIFEEMDHLVLGVEIGREAVSILMLAAVGWLAGRRPLERFVWFLYAFGIWDVSYYLFLYLVLGWPSSLAVWDVLFLIPLPWVAPVWAPAIVALSFILAGWIFLFQEDRGRPLRPTKTHWLLAAIGACFLILSFCWDGRQVMDGGVPENFPWWLWLLGLVMGLGAFARAVYRSNLLNDT